MQLGRGSRALHYADINCACHDLVVSESQSGRDFFLLSSTVWSIQASYTELE